MAAKLLAVVSSLLVVALSAAAGVAADSGDKMTICHMPPGNDQGARTMQVPRSAWSGHRGHGDHEGACTEADRKAHPPSPPPAPARPQATRLGLEQRAADGELDGDASFKVVLVNHGPAAATDVRLDGVLRGDGRWTLRADVAGCTLAKERISCEVGTLAAESSAAVRLDYEGHLDVCREVGIDLAATAANDSTAGDDRAKATALVGACSPLDR